MYEKYLRQIEDEDKISTWEWLRKNYLKRYNEALICSAQPLRTNYTKFHIDETTD